MSATGEMSAAPAASDPHDVEWPPEFLRPSDGLVNLVTDALYALSHSQTEKDANLRVEAGMAYVTMCSENISFERLLDDQSLVQVVV